MHQHHPERRGFEPAAGLHAHVVPLTHVVDVYGDAGVRADAVFFHQRDELSLGQVVRGRGQTLHQLGLGKRGKSIYIANVMRPQQIDYFSWGFLFIMSSYATNGTFYKKNIKCQAISSKQSLFS